MKISLRKVGTYLIWFQIYYNIIVKFLINDLGFSPSLNYVTDIVLIMILIISIRLGLLSSIVKEVKPVLRIAVIFLIVGLISAIINFTPIPLYLWALRNSCRFFIFFICCIKILEFKSVVKQFIRFEIILWLNAIIMTFQYFYFGMRGDYLNGIFGNYTGGNSSLNTFMGIYTAILMTLYMRKLLTTKKILVLIFIMSYISALNELKIYFLELALFAIFLVVFQIKSRKINYLKIFKITIALLIVIFIFIQLFYYLYPGFSDFFNIKNIIEYSGRRSYNSNTFLYTRNGQIPILNRFTSFSIIPKFFFVEWYNWIFGIGMGNAEYSSIDILTSNFYRLYSDLNYLGYSVSYILLENGFLGLTSYIAIFVVHMKSCLNMSRLCVKFQVNDWIFLLGAILSVFVLLLCIYNSALRIESSGYIMFGCLAFPYIFMKDFRKEQNNGNKKYCKMDIF